MSKNYNVIWFDDKWPELNIIREAAHINDINLVGFKSAEEGITELEQNIHLYDAAILDGRFYLYSTQSGDIYEDKAFIKVANCLERLKPRKLLPWFILSGNATYTEQKNGYADNFDKIPYEKNKPGQLEKLWEDVKSAADKQPETQIKHKYAEVFSSLDSEYFGSEAASVLLEILKSLHFDHPVDPRKYYNLIRQILEKKFQACNRKGILPDIFVKSQNVVYVYLNDCSRFLSGQNIKNYEYSKAVFPKAISENVRHLIAICNPASHDNPTNDFIKELNTPYLIYALTFELMDVLIWFRNYIDINPDVEQNKKLWKKVETQKPEGE
jgi:hypothetical protein